MIDGDASGTNKLALWGACKLLGCVFDVFEVESGPGTSGKEGGREGEEDRRGG